MVVWEQRSNHCCKTVSSNRDLARSIDDWHIQDVHQLTLYIGTLARIRYHLTSQTPCEDGKDSTAEALMHKTWLLQSLTGHAAAGPDAYVTSRRSPWQRQLYSGDVQACMCNSPCSCVTTTGNLQHAQARQQASLRHVISGQI